MKRTSGHQSGFTIIEVLIVLTVAALILMIVLLAVPALNRVARNHSRKLATDHVAAAMEEYKDTHLYYPITSVPDRDDRTAFVNYLQSQQEFKNFKIRYTDDNVDHRYPFAGPGAPADPNDVLDEISIIPGHICNIKTGGPGDVDYPIRSVGTYGTDYKGYAVFTLIEGYGIGSSPTIYCIDNGYDILYSFQQHTTPLFANLRS